MERHTYVCIEEITIRMDDPYVMAVFSVGDEIDLSFAYGDCIGGERYLVYLGDRNIGSMFTEQLKCFKRVDGKSDLFRWEELLPLMVN